MVFSAGYEKDIICFDMEKDIICLPVEGCQHNYGYSVGGHIRTIYLLTNDSFVIIFSHIFLTIYVTDLPFFRPEHVHVRENLFIFPY